MMNVICRAIARLGNTEATGKVFESYGVWGLAPDADSYNAVMESCEAAKKVAAVEGLISYMTSKGVQPNGASWALLLSTALRAEDHQAAINVIDRIRMTGADPGRLVLKRAFDEGHKKKEPILKTKSLLLMQQFGHDQYYGRSIRLMMGDDGSNNRRSSWALSQQDDGGAGGSGSGSGSSSSSRQGYGSRSSSRNGDGSSSSSRSGRVDQWQPQMKEQKQKQEQAHEPQDRRTGATTASTSNGSSGGLRSELLASLDQSTHSSSSSSSF
jgi:pentatricopeptide repeat protein